MRANPNHPTSPQSRSADSQQIDRIVATALLVLFALVCCSPPSAAEPCGGFTDMRLYVACLQNQISSGCGDACETNMIEHCPRDTYSVGDYCMPKSNKICTNGAVYTNGTCQVYQRPSCPPQFTYNNGVCVGLVPETACKKNSLNCTIPTNHCQGAFGSCDHPTTCSNGLVLFNGSCVSPDVAKCPEPMTLVNGICVRQKLPCEKTGNCTHSCPTESKMVNGTCVRVSPCPEGSFQIGGICAKCPLGSFYALGECLNCPPYTFYENDLCVCPGGTTLFNNTCMDNPFPVEPEIDNVDDADKDWLSANTEKVVHGNQSLGRYKYTHIFNVTENINLEESSNKIDDNEECCLIIEPMICEKNGLKYRCIKRRHHVCGDQCKEKQTNESINPYSLIEPRSDKTSDSTQSVNQISNQDPFQQTLTISSPQVANKPPLSQHHHFNPLNSFIYHHPNTPITQTEMINIENPLLNYNDQFKILLNYTESNTHNQPLLMDYPQSMQDQQIFNQQPIDQHQMFYQYPSASELQINPQPFQQQQVFHQQPIQEQQIINQQSQEQQIFYQQPVQNIFYEHHDQKTFHQQPNYQQLIQEPQMIFQQTLQEYPNSFQQLLQTEHQPRQEVMYGQQLQEHQMIYQQPMEVQQMMYQPEQFIGPTNCDVCL